MDKRVAVLVGLVLCGGAWAGAPEPIRIGVVASTTGPQADGGVYTVNGARLALDEINAAGGVLGRPLKLVVEDNQSTNPGAVLAFNKLMSDGGIAAVLGPIRSTETQAISPAIAKFGIPTMIGATDTRLTHANNPWLFRTRPHNGYAAWAMAEFGVNVLKHRKWAIVHSTDAFGADGAQALTDSLRALGVTPVFKQGFTNNTQDFTAVALALRKSDAQVLATFITMQTDVAILAKQMRQMGISMPWVGSPSVAGVSAMQSAGEALHGTWVALDFVPDADEVTRAFTTRYRSRHGSDPDFFASWAYDAIQIVAQAMRTSNSTHPDAVRNAILGVKGYQGVEGQYAFDRNGDGLHGYSVVRNESGRLVFVQRLTATGSGADAPVASSGR